MNWIKNKLYLADLMVRMAHHSTAIEGNTLTQGDSRSILIDGIIPPKAIRLREVYEVANYKYFISFLETNYEKPIDIFFIQDVHRRLLQSIDPSAGQFKTAENMIVGASFLPVHPSQVRPALIEWCGNLSWRLAQGGSNEEKVSIIMDAHIRFETIHPFSDGNGRTGRALIIASCAQEHLLPIVIEKEQRAEYIARLNDEDAQGLTAMALALQEKERLRLRRAMACSEN